MGRYIVWTDVTARYADFPKGPDSSTAEAALIPQAEAEVDGRLGVKYSVPFSPAPYLVKDLAIDLTYYKATIRQESSKLIKEYIDQRFEAIIAGTLVLSNSLGAVSGTGNFAWASNSYHSSVGLDSEVDWAVDSQAIYDFQSARGAL